MIVDAKRLTKITDLELMSELSEMFEIASKKPNEGTIQDGIKELILSMGEASSIYCRFLDDLESKRISEIKEQRRMDYLLAFNTSIGNLLGALVRLTLKCKLNNQDIHNGYTNMCNNYQVEDYAYPNHQLQTLTQLSRFINIQSQVYNNPEYNLRPMIYLQHAAEFDIAEDEKFLIGGRIVNHSFLTLLHKYIFDINIANHWLHWAWMKGEFEDDNEVFSSKVLNVWVCVFVMLDALGYGWDELQRVYAVTQK
jgi:hypothetical protein